MNKETRNFKKTAMTIIRLNILLVFMLVILVSVGVVYPAINASADSTFKYKDYSIGKTVSYSGIVPTYVIDGYEVDLSEQPPMLSERNIAYASAGALFKDAIGTTAKYSSSKKCITIKYKGHVLKMYIGKTLAYIDGEEIEAPCAPYRVKYKSSKKTATMVPTRFVAETLGMEYYWDAATSTVTIKTPFYYELNGEKVKYEGTRGKITFEGEEVELLDTPSIILEDTALLSTKSRVFKATGIDFDYNKKTGLIKVEYDGNTVLYSVDSRIAYVNGLLSRCSYAPTVFFIYDRDADILYIPGRFTMENLGFNYVWNSATGTSEISTYKEEVPEVNEDDGNGADTETSTEQDTDITNIDTEEGLAETGEGVDGTGTDTTETGNTDADGSNDDGSNENGSDENTQPEVILLPKELINVINTNDGYKFFIDKENCIQTLKLPVPSGVTAADFDMHEDIIGCMTELKLKGNYTEFYKDVEIDNPGQAILQIQMYYDPNTDETLIRLFSDIVLGCELSDNDDGTVNVRMDFVKNLYKKVIVLDAGHGGHDPGAQAEGYNESDLNLKVILNCRELFKDSDVKVFYTRIDDTFQTLYDRADFAELVGADLFISVHHNSSWYNTIKGTSVYYGNLDTYTSLNGLTSEKLATLMLENLTEDLNTEVFATGVINKNFVVVRDSKAPAVLLEIGFMSCPEELERLVKDKFSKKVAKTIYNTVLSIYADADK
ncbi:MAG: N-acetylmuramoyl-L-alanine amidase [Lachnospiraceae bacterium]|nr:N-acetylmuramoyl-L-alanine amidase [Lachnospiraceae bacterium]